MQQKLTYAPIYNNNVTNNFKIYLQNLSHNKINSTNKVYSTHVNDFSKNKEERYSNYPPKPNTNLISKSIKNKNYPYN